MDQTRFSEIYRDKLKEMMMQKVTYLILLFIVIISYGCNNSENPTENQGRASIQITTNISTSLTSLIKDGATVKSLIGSGTISEIVPGNYILTVEAQSYASQTENITLSDGQTLQKNVQLETKMIYIPSSTFFMGSTTIFSSSDERPNHQVTLSAYEIGRYEVTQKEWRSVMGTNPSYFQGDNRPVEQVSWNDVISFCNKLSESEGLSPVYSFFGSASVSADWKANGYRLPTEAEWENAADYHSSITLEDIAWYHVNSKGTTHGIGEKERNELGMYDLIGNVWEWCWDWYLSYYYTSASQTDPKGPSSGIYRVARGGGFDSPENHCTHSKRFTWGPTRKHIATGFRLARSR